MGVTANPMATKAGAAASAQAAALHLKVALDVAREALRAERAQTAKVTKALAQAVALLESTQDQADRLDALAEGYSEALTQVLAPTPEDLA